MISLSGHDLDTKFGHDPPFLFITSVPYVLTHKNGFHTFPIVAGGLHFGNVMRHFLTRFPQRQVFFSPHFCSLHAYQSEQSGKRFVQVRTFAPPFVASSPYGMIRFPCRSIIFLSLTPCMSKAVALVSRPDS